VEQQDNHEKFHTPVVGKKSNGTTQMKSKNPKDGAKGYG
jgi:hypothetical protein